MKATEHLRSAVRAVHMPDDARARLISKINSLPTDGEVYQAEPDRAPVLRYAFTALAACAVIAVSGAGIAYFRNAAPPLSPASELAAAPAVQEDFTPFGDLSQTRPHFFYPEDDLADLMEEQSGDRPEVLLTGGTISFECETAVRELFRVCGWEPVPENTLDDASKAIPEEGDHIVMRLYTDPENEGGEYLTAYFRLDGVALVRVDTAEGSAWYGYREPEEFERCLRAIILEHDADTVFTPVNPYFTAEFDVFRRIQYMTDGDGSQTDLTDGQEAALVQYLREQKFYPWNLLRARVPEGRFYCLI